MKTLKTIAKLLLTFGTLYYVLYKIDLSELVKTLGSVDVRFLVAALILLVLAKITAAKQMHQRFISNKLNLALVVSILCFSNDYFTTSSFRTMYLHRPMVYLFARVSRNTSASKH